MLSRRISNGRAGLSLLELLVSLSLLALIAAGLAGAFGVGTQVFDRAQSLNSHQGEIAARRQLRAALMQALPPNRITPFPNSFVGAPDRLAFVTMAEAPFSTDAAALTYSVQWNGTALLLDVAAIDDEGAVINGWQHVLASDVSNVTFRFLNTEGDSPVWQPTWADQPGLPALVQITGEGGAPAWVEFTVAPRL